MAEVYRAHDRVLGREVAVKLLKGAVADDSDLRGRLVREARAAASLHLPSVVQVHDIDQSGRFIVMELINGETLAQRLKRGPLTSKEVRALAKNLLAALGAAHLKGIVHRDVKPSNILLTPEGAKLADFGVAQLPDGVDLTRTGTAVGTITYMAPEQLRGSGGSPLSDIYSAGVTLFEAATAKRFHDTSGTPHPDAERTVLKASGDRRLAEAITRATAFDPKQRFATAADLLAHLDRRMPARRVVGAVLGVLVLAALAAAGIRYGPRLLQTESQRRLAEGIEALERHDLERANTAFESVVLDDPKNADALFHMCLAVWWLGRPPAEVEQKVSLALLANTSPGRRGLLEGLLLLQANDYPKARTYFEDLATRFPNDREIAYGLFEARYHGGYPDEAMLAHHRLRQLDPEFQLGDMHARDYYLAHGRLDELERLLGKQLDADLWPLFIAAARGELTHARQLTATYVRKNPDNAYALLLQIDLAILTNDRAALEPVLARFGQAHDQRLALASLSGDDAAWRTHRDGLLESSTKESEAGRVAIINMLLMGAASRPGTDSARELLAAVAGLDVRSERGLRINLGRAFQWARLEDRAQLDALAASGYPEVAAAATALRAELDGQWALAAAQWSRAITTSSGGEYLPVEWYGLARAANAVGDDEAVLKACDSARHPYRYYSTWAVALEPCLLLSAKVHVRRNEPEAARADLKLLLSWRDLAPEGDPLLAAAKELSSQLR